VLTDLTNPITLTPFKPNFDSSTTADYVEYVQKIQLNAISLIGSSNEKMTPEMTNELVNLFTSSNNLDLNGCLSGCSNKGLCKLNSQLHQFYCECYEGYGGKSCQTDLRPCSSKSTCINNSTCTNIKLENKYDSEGNQMYSFECICLAHHFGDHCDM
jgi:hypothetical protein